MNSSALIRGAALALAFAGLACAKPTNHDYSKELLSDNSYIIGTGDVLRVAVYRNDELTTQATVRPDGSIALPLVGDVQAQGKTAKSFADEVGTRYQTYIDEPRVTVSLVERRSYRVYVLGEVTKPGAIAPSDPVNVLQALSLAGGFSRFANRGKIVIVRRDGTTEERIPFDYNSVMKGKNPRQNFVLRSGDTIIVP